MTELSSPSASTTGAWPRAPTGPAGRVQRRRPAEASDVHVAERVADLGGEPDERVPPRGGARGARGPPRLGLPRPRHRRRWLAPDLAWPEPAGLGRARVRGLAAGRRRACCARSTACSTSTATTASSSQVCDDLLARAAQPPPAVDEPRWPGAVDLVRGEHFSAGAGGRRRRAPCAAGPPCSPAVPAPARPPRSPGCSCCSPTRRAPRATRALDRAGRAHRQGRHPAAGGGGRRARRAGRELRRPRAAVDRVGRPEALTLHRLLGWRPDNATRFRHDRGNRLKYDVVVVDESLDGRADDDGPAAGGRAPAGPAGAGRRPRAADLGRRRRGAQRPRRRASTATPPRRSRR